MLKMQKFREEESRRLKELANNSRNAVLKLREYCSLGEKILKTAELCKKITFLTQIVYLMFIILFRPKIGDRKGESPAVL